MLQLASRLHLKYLLRFIFLLFYHIFVSPGDAPGAITLNVVWMEFDAYKLSRSMYHLSSTVSQIFEPQVPKNAIFTYRRPHCFPWRCPCDYHAICCMNGKTIQCLQNPSQHVSIYLQSSIVSELYDA